MDISLEDEMHKDADVIKYLGNRSTAADFYRALCNRSWKKINYAPKEEQLIDKLKGEDPSEWSCSWRHAGGIIAEIRNTHYSTKEDYMNFYCCGYEGRVTELVMACFERMGWLPIYDHLDDLEG